MIKSIVFTIWVLGVSTSFAQGQFTARGLTSKIAPPPAQSPSATAPNAPAAAKPAASKPPIVSPLVRVLDTNHNGVIEAGEIANATEALKELDKNGDGQLTADEYLGDGESTTSPLVTILDINKNGVIDEKELAKASQSLRMLDKNMDGKLNPSEFRPVRAEEPKAVAGGK